MNILTIFIIMFLTSIIKNIYICNMIIFYYCIKFSNSLFNFLSIWSNNIDIWGNIPDWLSAIFSIIAGIFIPLILYKLGKKDELARKIENEKNEKKNQELLSVERRGKLFSTPLINKDSHINIYNYKKIPNICVILKDYCVMSEKEYTDNYLNCRNIRISIPLKETTSINITEVLIEEIDIINTEKENVSKFLHVNLDNKYKKVFLNNINVILNVYIVLEKDDEILKYLSSKGPLLIIIKLKAKNPFNIQTVETLNAKITFDHEEEIEEALKYTYRINFSLIQVDSITDEN